MMRRPTRITATLAAGLLLALGFTTPAKAADITVTAIKCDWVINGGESHYRLTGGVTFENDWDAGVRLWKSFRYRLTRVSGSGAIGTHSNVNVQITEKYGLQGERIAYTYESRDDREWGVLYTVRLTRPPTTGITPHDHRSLDLIEFTAIFDQPAAQDPSCTAWKRIGGQT
jgi:hypothetical protein